MPEESRRIPEYTPGERQKRSSKEGPRQSLAEYERIIGRLLRDHSVVYQGGESFIDFSEKGPHRQGGLPLSAAYIRRYFQNRPEEMACIKRYFLDEAEADSHILLEGKIREFRRYDPTMAGAVDDLYFRSTAGHGDEDFVRLLARKGNLDAQTLIWRRDNMVRLLAFWFWNQGIDLYATQVLRKSIRDSDKTEEIHEIYYERYKELICEDAFNMTSGEAMRQMEDEYGITYASLRRIMQSRREVHGDPPAEMGRPRKKRGRRKKRANKSN